MAKIAVKTLASGGVEDLLCSAGPRDRPFEERHASVSIAIVLKGTFEYRAGNSPGELMTPGSFLLGNAGGCFGHAHATGDRCLSFHYSPERFEEIAADAGAKPWERRFGVLRLSPACGAFGLSPLQFRRVYGSRLK